jgi:regulator of replication initiation timing
MPYKTLQEELIELKSQAVNLQLKIQKTMTENSILYCELAATTLKLAEQERKLEQKLKQKLFETVRLNDDPERDDRERKFITKHQNSPSNPRKLSKM